MNKNNMYFTTGEFAKICNVTKHTLFHYNDIGVFIPQFTDENGYRYYHALQYDTFCTIMELRDIGMSLPEIKIYLEHRSPSALIDLFMEQEKTIDAKIKRLKEIKSNLEAIRNNVKAAITPHDEFFIKHEPQDWLVQSVVLNDADDYDMTLAIGDLINSNSNFSYHNFLGMMHPTFEIESGNYNKGCQFYFRTIQDKKNKNGIVKPEGDYLITYHYGSYESLENSFNKIINYAKKNQYKLREWFYEETIVGDWAVHSSEDYIIKISVQIII